MRRPVGSNHFGMRQFNERIVLQTIRLHGALPKAEVARLTRLSSQTASVLINGLLADGLVIKQNRVRGRVGQPSVPIALNPDGAFTLGIKVGRRSLDVLAMDFIGKVRYRELLEYDYPDPKIIFPAIERKLELVDAQLGTHSKRLVGVGVAAPLWLGGWSEFLGAPSGVMEAWKEISIRDRIQAMTPLPVEFAKDTTAACAAELVVGPSSAAGWSLTGVFIRDLTETRAPSVRCRCRARARNRARNCCTRPRAWYWSSP
jgi:hypothetical protein